MTMHDTTPSVIQGWPPDGDLYDEAMPRGRVGMFCLIGTESFFFAIFLTTYLFYTGQSLSGPQPSQVLDLGLVIVNSFCLLASSATITLAVRALLRGNRRLFLIFWGITIALGLEFLLGTAWEWRGLIVDDHLMIDTNLFGSTFYTLVGFHAFHVTVGLLGLTLILVLGLFNKIPDSQRMRVEYFSWYWHFVDVIWIFVFTTIYLIGR
jgi:cytochrome c oxidase subunit 3/cytochrome o ubiquinol oxidase subunit 3